jgi:membrane protein implicated in regulation of membrane protease activity
MRVVFSILAAIAVLIPGALLALQWGPSLVTPMCPTPDGPNLCVLLGTVILMAVVPLILSVIAAVVVWKTMSTKEEQA